MKISVFGTGRVGGATAFALAARGVPHDLVDEARQGGEQVARIKGYTNYAAALSATVIREALDRVLKK